VSPSLPVVSGAEAVRSLAKVGFFWASQRGSHVKLRHDDGRVAIVPLHRELARGTLRSVLRQAGISTDEFAALLE
jgi:predicted RNA binding protein YcfA (HicA-like mRNA interferase family)